VEAAATGSRKAALRALALHPLVDSASAADRILTAAGW
jgi:6-phospho-beta-glucosidase